MLTFVEPMSTITKYITFLHEFYYDFTHSKLRDAKLNLALDIVLSDDSNYETNRTVINYTKILLYSILINPTEVKNYYLSHTNFYDVLESNAEIRIKCRTIETLFAKKHLFEKFQCCIKFIKNISTKSPRITETMINNYIKFLYLLKINPETTLIPTTEIDIIWYGHTLDYETYHNDTIKYFGYLLKHNVTTNKTNNEITIHFEDTKILWHKTYYEKIKEIKQKLQSKLNFRQTRRVTNDFNSPSQESYVLLDYDFFLLCANKQIIDNSMITTKRNTISTYSNFYHASLSA